MLALQSTFYWRQMASQHEESCGNLFGSPSFNALTWINSLLSSQPDLLNPKREGGNVSDERRFQSVIEKSSNVDNHLDNTVGAHGAMGSVDVLSEELRDLQGVSRKAHAALDGAIAQALAAVPNVVRDSDKVRQRAVQLRIDIDGVSERVAGVEGAVSAAVTAIADADTIVRRVEETVDLLGQVSHVDSLLARLDSLLTSSASDGSELVIAADVVAELRSSLEVLRFIPQVSDRFDQLNAADKKLETLAAPRLREALEHRNATAACNARIVFDRAGRENAFITQYVSIRASQVSEMWVSTWGGGKAVAEEGRQKELHDRESEKRSHIGSSVGHGSTDSVEGLSAPRDVPDLLSTDAAMNLDSFFEKLIVFLRSEAEWLSGAFPNLRPRLLPSLVSTSLSELHSPRIDDLRPGRMSVSSAGIIRLHHVALRSIRAAGDIGSVLISNLQTPESPTSQETAENDVQQAFGDHSDISVLVHDAMLSVLFPNVIFWETWASLASRTAEMRMQELPLEVSKFGNDESHTAMSATFVSLEEIAKRVENITKPSVAIVDKLFEQVVSWTEGVGVLVIPPVCSAASAVLSKRLNSLIELGSSKPSTAAKYVDEWANIAGSLRLLRAISGLKQSWEFRRESGMGLAAKSAVKLLDMYSSSHRDSAQYVTSVMKHVEVGSLAEASAFCEMMRSEGLAEKVRTVLERAENASDDFSSLLLTTHRVVYDSMLAGVQHRFDSFDRETTWKEESVDGAMDSGLLGLTSSPLPYATEVADYLMTIPQQLEPFVPEEDIDDGYATPCTIYAFSTKLAEAGHRSAGFRRESGNRENNAALDAGHTTSTSGGDDRDTDSGVGDGIVRSFAGMWIGTIAVGTMEIYVEKICSIKALSTVGARQLAIDVDYMCNVLATLGVVVIPELDLVRKLLECAPTEESFKSVSLRTKHTAHLVLLRRIASLRGVCL